ncbi:hypothetical protein B4096_0664 [Heyndrickxia coagulans]|nr:hypothetical protein B4100_0695 [Heyndrickxia coagulans]KYC77702.1 hypothetical protein B4096_0664 [Heyndrickxia coagulans]
MRLFKSFVICFQNVPSFPYFCYYLTSFSSGRVIFTMNQVCFA